MINVPDGPRNRLLSLAGAERIRAVASGHLHSYRRRVRPDMLEVWGPSTGVMGQAEPSHFEQLGVVEWNLHDEQASAWFRAPTISTSAISQRSLS